MSATLLRDSFGAAGKAVALVGGGSSADSAKKSKEYADVSGSLLEKVVPVIVCRKRSSIAKADVTNKEKLEKEDTDEMRSSMKERRREAPRTKLGWQQKQWQSGGSSRWRHQEAECGALPEADEAELSAVDGESVATRENEALRNGTEEGGQGSRWRGAVGQAGHDAVPGSSALGGMMRQRKLCSAHIHRQEGVRKGKLRSA
ncbi:hypothetical protein ZWY2020_020787 [Hordeum vulgare]|nr:hypothetical protein ZWY2020_020787 [Hordeum vulgare]